MAINLTGMLNRCISLTAGRMKLLVVCDWDMVPK
jgi:hypothetical protein